MENREKMLSYVKYEHELETEYREKLAEAKRKSDVRDVFAEFIIKLLRKLTQISLLLYKNKFVLMKRNFNLNSLMSSKNCRRTF